MNIAKVLVNRWFKLSVAVLFCLLSVQASAQTLNGFYTTEGEWANGGRTNLVNLLRLEGSIPLGKNTELNLATLHLLQDKEHLIPDNQGFSNIDGDNMLASLAVLGINYQRDGLQLFGGVRNMNEDYFTSPVTALFTNSSCGVFPTLASMPIANYPYSSLCIHSDFSWKNWEMKFSLYNGLGYNGWTHHNFPFRVNLKDDGVFILSEFSYHKGYNSYFVGAATHNKLFYDENMVRLPERENVNRWNCVYYLYAEQNLWSDLQNRLNLLLQYSHASNSRMGCHDYAGAGCEWNHCDNNRYGLFLQYGCYAGNKEYSMEMTVWRKISDHIAVQPAFHWIRNDNGGFVVGMLRLYCNFSIFNGSKSGTKQ